MARYYDKCRTYRNHLIYYQGFDPDIGNFGGVLAAGVDYGFYPQARTIMGGFNIKF